MAQGLIFLFWHWSLPDSIIYHLSANDYDLQIWFQSLSEIWILILWDLKRFEKLRFRCLCLWGSVFAGFFFCASNLKLAATATTATGATDILLKYWIQNQNLEYFILISWEDKFVCFGFQFLEIFFLLLMYMPPLSHSAVTFRDFLLLPGAIHFMNITLSLSSLFHF